MMRRRWIRWTGLTVYVLAWVAIAAHTFHLGNFSGSKSSRSSPSTNGRTRSQAPVSDSSSSARFTQAIQAANQSQFVQALKTAAAIPATDPNYPAVQALKQEWSSILWDQAQTHFSQADVQGALTLVSSIPMDIPVYEQIKRELPTWRKMNAIVSSAESAVKGKNWQQALFYLEQLQATPLYRSAKIQQWLATANQNNIRSASAVAAPPPPPVPMISTVPVPAESSVASATPAWRSPPLPTASTAPAITASEALESEAPNFEEVALPRSNPLSQPSVARSLPTASQAQITLSVPTDRSSPEQAECSAPTCDFGFQSLGSEQGGQ